MAKKKKQENPAKLEPPEKLCHYLGEIQRMAAKARRAQRSLSGNNDYADRFHQSRIHATRAYKELKAAVAPIANPGLDRTLSDIGAMLSHFIEPALAPRDRTDLRREIEALVRTEAEPALRSVSGQGVEFLPMDMVEGTRGYVVKVTQQINGCFQHNHFDACGVMTRRLLETLIIEVFEKKGIADKIKNPNGDYLMFSELVTKIINTQDTPIGRTTRKELPGIAAVLNNCAHSRSFNISRGQLMRYQAYIVIAVQELVGLWEIRKS
jgi:hypothetical protein